MVRPPSTTRDGGGVGNNNNNVGVVANSGRYKGVRMRKWGKWVAEVRQPNSRHRIWLGSYESPEKAARAYDAAVFCLRGPSALLNFPDAPPDIPSASVLSPSQIQVVASRHAHCVRQNAEYEVKEEEEEEKAKFRALSAPLAREVLGSAPQMESTSEYVINNSSFGGFSTEDCCVPVDGGGAGGGEGEVNLTAGVFYQSPRAWTF